MRTPRLPIFSEGSVVVMRVVVIGYVASTGNPRAAVTGYVS